MAQICTCAINCHPDAANAGRQTKAEPSERSKPMTTHEKHEENIGKLREMIKGVECAMLTTVEDDGSLRSRPMAIPKVEFDGDLYFFTKANTPKVNEVE